MVRPLARSTKTAAKLPKIKNRGSRADHWDANIIIFFGWLSDHIGRKPVILGGMLLAAVTYYPLYAWLGSATQPGNINYPIAIIIVAILVAYVGMVYGPISAFPR